ncbi:MAG: hypothetical protein PHX38_02675 [Sulfuricella sp.]|nr:hypothetical protein [Sulfuricella sp.]
MTESIDEPVLLHRPLNGIRECSEALDSLIGTARRHLRIFDYNLEDGGYNSPHRLELLRAFLLEKRGNRLEVVLHDTDYLTRFCPRMLGLLRQFNHAVEIRETTAQAKSIYDPFAVADQANYVHRFHYDAPRALFALNDVAGSHALIKRFEEIKPASEPISATMLGL